MHFTTAAGVAVADWNLQAEQTNNVKFQFSGASEIVHEWISVQCVNVKI